MPTIMPKSDLLKKLKTPPGARDILLQEGVLRQFIQEKLSETFLSWGYQPVTTPVFEYYDALIAGLGEDLKDKIFKVVDSRGHLLALRPDMTTPLARLAASRLNSDPLPLRLSYQSHVFRFDADRRMHLEFPQAGVELLGSDDPLADAESLLVAINSFIAVGLDSVQVVLGDQGFLNKYLSSLALDLSQIQEIRKILAKKDYVELEDYIQSQNLPQKKELMALIAWMGKDEVFIEAKKQISSTEAQRALGRLESIYHLLSAAGYEKHLRVDLGMSEDFAYYTGIIFDLYLPNFGKKVGRGGRYDGLLAQYGYPLPAVGFAVNVDMLQNHLARQEQVEFKPLTSQVLVAVEDSSFHLKGIEIAQGLRSQKNRVELEVMARDLEEAKVHAYKKNIPILVSVGQKIRIFSLVGGIEKEIPVERLGQIVQGEVVPDADLLG